MLHPRRGRDREQGQIIVLAAVAFILILAVAALWLMTTIRSVKAVVTITLHSCMLNQCRRQVGLPTITAPRSWTPW